MELRARNPDLYLDADDIIDVTHPEIQALAAVLARGHSDETSFARAAYEQVRDGVSHSLDAQDPRVTLVASDVLRERVGLCYAKSHLLAALLRAQGIPTGLCYQRLTDGENTFVLHGLVAVYIRGRWHRQDARGNKAGVDAQFRLDTEKLAWPADPTIGERDFPEVFVRPHPVVVAALSAATDILDLCRGGLPTGVPAGIPAGVPTGGSAESCRRGPPAEP